jgi:hypothetical protein
LGPGNATAAGALTWARGFLSPSPIWAVSSLSPRGYNPSVISHRLYSLEKGVVLSAGWWLADPPSELPPSWSSVGSEISRGRTSGWVPCPVLSYASTGSSQPPATGGVFIFVASCSSQNRRPWASSVFPSTPLARRGFIIVVAPMWVYSFLQNGHGVGGSQQLFTLFVVQATTTTSDGASMHACISSRRFQASSFA